MHNKDVVGGAQQRCYPLYTRNNVLYMSHWLGAHGSSQRDQHSPRVAQRKPQCSHNSVSAATVQQPRDGYSHHHCLLLSALCGSTATPAAMQVLATSDHANLVQQCTNNILVLGYHPLRKASSEPCLAAIHTAWRQARCMLQSVRGRLPQNASNTS